MANLLVTGGAGFIGANFVHYWFASHPGDMVVVLDALTYAGNQSSLEGVLDRQNCRFVKGDIASPGLAAGLLRENAITTIVHFAAESHVDRSIQGPDVFVQTNIAGTHELLKAARQVWLEEGRGSATSRFHQTYIASVDGTVRRGVATMALAENA